MTRNLAVLVLLLGVIGASPVGAGEFSFDFRGLRDEMRRADAIVHINVQSWVPDTGLGWDPGSKTWQRVTLHGTVLGSAKGPFRTGDTLQVVAAYSRRNGEFYELEEKTQQFVWGIVPASPGSESVLLLERVASVWEVTRSLYPDDAFVGTYVHAAASPSQDALPELIRMFIAEFLANDRQHWGHIRVIQDDLERLHASDAANDELWRAEAIARAEDLVRKAGALDGPTLVPLAHFLPENRRRECVCELVRAYDAAEEERKQLGDVDWNPDEMTWDLYRAMNTNATLALLPSTMEALMRGDSSLPREGRIREDARKILARARRYAGPRCSPGEHRSASPR